MSRDLCTLIVDYGGVLTSAVSETMADWAEAEGCDAERLGEVIRGWVRASYAHEFPDDPVRGLETGALEAVEFERLLAIALQGDGGPVIEPVGLLDRMFAGFAPVDSMNRVVLEARTSGLRTGLLSNSWGNTYDRSLWDLMFDDVVISGEVGLRKPDPAIYRLAAERLGVDPAECVFVDDIGPNVTAAVSVGMVGVHHQSPSQTIGELEVLFARPLSS